MPAIDLFCRVVDNYGDIGVCWRLARQLVTEHNCRVRLVVDDLSAFQFVAPEIDPSLTRQHVLGVEVLDWQASDVSAPAEIVIEAFACNPSDAYVLAMAALVEKPVWINLEYLSAEVWVDGVHGLPSPQPKLPLIKYFFCPGFTETSGGLIREAHLDAARRASKHDKRTTLFAFAIYPTPDNAHFVKLDAWLDRYCDGLATAAATALRRAQHAFNRGDENNEQYADFAAQLPTLQAHADRWRDHLFGQTDLATRLLNFVISQKKQKTS